MYELIIRLSKVSGSKAIMKTSIVFIYTSNKQVEFEAKHIIPSIFAL